MFETVKSYYAGKFTSKGEWMHSVTMIDTYELIVVTPVNTDNKQKSTLW